jgi:integrase
VKFSEYVQKWKDSARLNVSEGWKQSQDMMLELHISPAVVFETEFIKLTFAEIELTEIKPEHITKVLEASRAKGHKPNTTKQIYLLLSKLFNDAHDFFDLITRSPVRAAHHSPRVPKKEAPYLKPDEMDRLIQFAKYHWAIQAIVIQSFLGLRIGEAIGLKWNAVCFDTMSIYVFRKWNKKTQKIDDFTKNLTPYRVPFAGNVAEFLHDVYRTLKPRQDDFVCPGPSGGMMSYNSYQKALRYLCKGAGVPVVSSHAFRHSCSARWKRAGATLDDRQMLFNHDDGATTKIYDHDDYFRLQELAAKVMTMGKTKLR